MLFGTDDFDTAHVSSMIYYPGSGYVSKYTRINYPCPAHLAFVVYYTLWGFKWFTLFTITKWQSNDLNFLNTFQKYFQRSSKSECLATSYKRNKKLTNNWNWMSCFVNKYTDCLIGITIFNTTVYSTNTGTCFF